MQPASKPTSNADMALPVADYKNIKDTEPTVDMTTIAEVVEGFKVHEARPTKDGDAYSFVTFKPGKEQRKNENIESVHALVFDFDEIDDLLRQQIKRFAKTYCSIRHTTYNHTVEKPRERLIVFLQTPIPGEKYGRVYETINSKEFGSKADHSTKSPCQLFYPPSKPVEDVDGHFVRSNVDGQLFDPRPFLIGLVNPKKGSVARDESEGQLIEEAQAIVEACFGGHLQHVAGQFYTYDAGAWRALDTDADVKRGLMQGPMKGKSLGNVSTMVEVLKILYKVLPSPDHEPPPFICVENGALDPFSGTLQAHSPEHGLFNRLPVPYDPEAECPQWIAFLESVWQGLPDIEDRTAVLQEFAGLTLLPTAKFQKMLWLVGPGSNGKSVVLDVLVRLVGKENMAAVHLDHFGQRFALAPLCGKLLNVSSEITANATLADHNLKAVVAGDIVQGERKHEQAFTFRPYAKIVAATNDLPRVLDSSHGFFRRLIILDFPRIFKEHEQDPDLSAKLETEQAGILAWAVEGLQRLLERGRFDVPESAKNIVAEYKATSNPVEMFKAHHLEHCDHGTCKKEVYREYREYCAENGFKPLNSAYFGRRLKALGVGDRKTKGHGRYRVKLVP